MSDQTGKTNAEEQEDSRIIEYGDEYRGIEQTCRFDELRYNELSGMVIVNADLHGIDLSEQDLISTDMSDTDLSDADLYRADLRSAVLWGTNLTRAYLRDADLSGADITGANLTGTFLSGANLYDIPQILQINNLPVGQLILKPTPEGWHLTFGNRAGPVSNLKNLVDQNPNHPDVKRSAYGPELPSLQAAVALCEEHVALWPNLIEELRGKWGATPQPTTTGEPDCEVRACGD